MSKTLLLHRVREYGYLHTMSGSHITRLLATSDGTKCLYYFQITSQDHGLDCFLIGGAGNSIAVVGKNSDKMWYDEEF
jgi:hypothetical protein